MSHIGSLADRPGTATGTTYARGRHGFVAEVSPCLDSTLDIWAKMAVGGADLPFQSRAWLTAWKTTLGRTPGAEPIAATIRDRDGVPLMAMPLVRRTEGRRRTITFADSGVTDYNAPILSARAPTDPASAEAMWRALAAALPRADVIRFERMPMTVGTKTNPLALLRGACAAEAGGLALPMPMTYAAWRQALPRRYRMELGRCERLFDQLPGARFARVEADAVQPILAELERLQRQRIASLGLPYVLDEAPIAAFYRALCGTVGDGPIVLTALTTEDGVIAVLYGMRRGAQFVMLRIAADEAHARLSPSRQLITRTMQLLREEGVEQFDFGLGDYPYKRKLGGQPVPLCDLVVARSPRGLPEAARFRLKANLRTRPRLLAGAERLRLLTKAPDKPTTI